MNVKLVFEPRGKYFSFGLVYYLESSSTPRPASRRAFFLFSDAHLFPFLNVSTVRQGVMNTESSPLGLVSPPITHSRPLVCLLLE